MHLFKKSVDFIYKLKYTIGMANIDDYILWRGDISFKVSPFNHIDSIVLCQILYAQLDTIVPSDLKKTISLSTAAQNYFDSKLNKINLGALINKKTADFFYSVGQSERFSNILLCGFRNIYDEKKEIQFAAMSALLPTGELCVIFRGTDDTIVGWKEDFNMSFLSPVPAQEHALTYLEDVSAHFYKKIYVMGHSKGGNLAVYSSAFCNSKTSKKIISVFDNDGPGFLKEINDQKCVKHNSKRVHSVIPESSIVGILLERHNKPTYILSSEKSSILQHDIFTWQLECNQFIIAPKQNITGEVTSKAVETWLHSISKEKREEFVNDLFSVLSATKAKTLQELNDDWVKNSMLIIKKMRDMDKDTKNKTYEILKVFFHAVQINIPPLKDLLLHGK